MLKAHQLPAFAPNAQPQALRVGQQHLAVVNLRGNARDPAFVLSVQQALGLALPVSACTTLANQRLRLVWVGPDDWFVLGPQGEQAARVAALRQALGDKRGIRRYGAAVIPMDEALAEAAVDISGRPFLAWSVSFAQPKIGEMDTELFEEFFRALAFNAGITLHVTQKAGTNAHHVAEACFKALARALREAVEPDPRAISAIPSTKGVLEA